MKKKLSILIIAVLLFSLIFTGCGTTTTVLENTGGEVNAATNGSAVVEKGDYVYFINGKANTFDDNKFNKVTKGALVRVKKADIAKIFDTNAMGEYNYDTTCKSEVVIPKLILSSQYNNAVYFFGDKVYFGTPSDKKNAEGDVKYTQTEFYSFDLKTGKLGSLIATSKDDTKNFMFTEKDGVVYLIYLVSTTEGETTIESVNVVNTETKKVWSSLDNQKKGYASIALPTNSGNTLFFSCLSYIDGLHEDTNVKYHDVYSYTVGDEKATLILSGAGASDIEFDKENLENAPTIEEAASSGITVNLIKNTGKYLIYSTTNLISDNPQVIFFGVDYTSNFTNLAQIDRPNDSQDDTNAVKLLGYSGGNIDSAITESSYYKSLESVFYVDGSGNYVEFNYKAPTSDTQITTYLQGMTDYTLYNVYEDGTMLFADKANTLYLTKIGNEKSKLYKLNGLSMVTNETFYKPSIIEVDEKKYLFGIYTETYTYNYMHVLDITSAMLDTDDDSPYQDAISELTSMDKEKTLQIHSTMIGVMTKSDKDAFNKYVKDAYPEED